MNPSEHDLPTLRINVGTTAGTRTQAIFQAVRSGEEPREITRCRLRELGLPPAAGELHLTPQEAFRVPENALNLLKATEFGPPGVLWLELRSPRGYLYVLPWERLLEPLGRPLLRRPQHALRPAASQSALRVGLCASAPAVLAQLCRVWRERSGFDVKIHVFTDASAVAGMREWAAGDDRPVVIPDPPPEKPWLPWIRDAMEGTALDVMHFAGHGYLDQDRGAIALANTPTSHTAQEMSRFVGAPEMTAFLSQVGAWCLALTGPVANFSATGLRELADAVSLAGPSVTMVHEMGTDDAEFRQLGDAVATVLGKAPSGLRPMPAVACWAQPMFVENSSFIDDDTHAMLARHDTPAWVASATRTVEALQAKWLPRDPSREMDPDAKAALQSISSLVHQHVSGR